MTAATTSPAIRRSSRSPWRATNVLNRSSANSMSSIAAMMPIPPRRFPCRRSWCRNDASPLPGLARPGAPRHFSSLPAAAQSKGDACALSGTSCFMSIPREASISRRRRLPASTCSAARKRSAAWSKSSARCGARCSSPAIDDQTRGQLVRVTGAVRSILSTQGNSAIRSFRHFDSPETTIALAFAARSEDPNLRINATLILADVIDNSTVCVPIDHLYDPGLHEVGGWRQRPHQPDRRRLRCRPLVVSREFRQHHPPRGQDAQGSRRAGKCLPRPGTCSPISRRG